MLLMNLVVCRQVYHQLINISVHTVEREIVIVSLIMVLNTLSHYKPIKDQSCFIFRFCPMLE